MLKKTIIFLILTLAIFSPIYTFAQDKNPDTAVTETFDAKVIKILEEKTTPREDGTENLQQNILLKGLSGTFKDKEFTYYGISDIDVLSMTSSRFKPGDKVQASWSQDTEGNDQFYVLNYVRRGYIYILGIIFAICIVFVGQKKGLRSLFSLVVSFLVITKFIVPKIVAGSNPLLIAFFGSILILSFIIYITDGFNRKANIAVISIAISLLLTFILSVIFVNLTRLSGFSSEETSFLVGMSGSNIIDFRGLLLAGILIGTLGVLDDVILGQIEAVNQIQKLNPNLSKKEVIKSANEIGKTHLGAMVNTLFLTYAGVSLPLLILFNISPDASVSFKQALDNELITTEIVRTLAGSIGLTLAFPISTYIAAYFLKPKT